MLLHEDTTHEIINAFYTVYNKLGYGFLEKVYENSLMIELRKRKFICEAQSQINVSYDGEIVGLYFADIRVNGLIIIDIKAAENICSEHETQLINYLKATKIEVGLLFNFGKRPQFKRKIYLNENKSD